MNTVAISNQKGGAAKTTTAIHLSGALNERGNNVLVVDLDKQGGLTNSLGYGDVYYDIAKDTTTMYDVLFDLDRVADVNDLIIPGEEFDIIPATERYMNRSNINQLAEAGRSHVRLELALDELETDYDWVVIDTTPDLNVLTDNAIVAARNVLVPFFPEELNKNSLKLLLKQLQSLRKLHGEINTLGLVASRVEKNSEHDDVVEEVGESFDMPVFEIRKRTALSQSIKAGGSIYEFNQDSDAEHMFQELAGFVIEEVDDE